MYDINDIVSNILYGNHNQNDSNSTLEEFRNSTESLNIWDTENRDNKLEYDIESVSYSLEEYNEKQYILTLKKINKSLFSTSDKGMESMINRQIRSLEEEQTDNGQSADKPVDPAVANKKKEMVKKMSEMIKKIINVTLKKLSEVRNQILKFFNEKNKALFAKTIADIQQEPSMHEQLANAIQSKIDKNILKTTQTVMSKFNNDIDQAMTEISNFYKELSGILDKGMSDINAAMSKGDNADTSKFKSVSDDPEIVKAKTKLSEIDDFNPTIYWAFDSSRDNKLQFDNKHISEDMYTRIIQFSTSLADAYKPITDKANTFINNMNNSSNPDVVTAAKGFTDILKEAITVGPAISANTAIQMMKILGWMQSEFGKVLAKKSGNKIKEKGKEITKKVKNKLNKEG